MKIVLYVLAAIFIYGAGIISGLIAASRAFAEPVAMAIVDLAYDPMKLNPILLFSYVYYYTAMVILIGFSAFFVYIARKIA